MLRDLSRGEINLRAMSLVYTTLLAVIPLLAFSFAVLKIFGGRRDLEPIVFEFFRPLGPGAAQELTTRILQFASRVSSGVVGSVGLALLAWTLVGTIKKVEDSFNFLWHVDQPRSFARRLAEYTGLLIAAPVILVGFVGLLHSAFASAPVQEVVHLPFLQRLRGVGLTLAPYAMVTAFFTALYVMIPNTRVHWRAALTGAAVAGVLWAADRQALHRLRGVLHAPHDRLCRLRLRGGGAAVDLLRLADPARRRAAVLLRAEPGVPAPRAAAAAPLERGARAAGAEADVLRGPQRTSPAGGAGR